jgi:citrate lyase beta subunit
LVHHVSCASVNHVPIGKKQQIRYDIPQPDTWKPHPMILIGQPGLLRQYRPDQKSLTPHRSIADSIFVGARVPKTAADGFQLLDRLTTSVASGVHIKGLDGPPDIEAVSTLLRVAEAMQGKASLKIIAEISTPKAALAIEAFHRAIPRLAALAFNPDALAVATDADVESDMIAAVACKIPLAAAASSALALIDLQTGVLSEEALVQRWRHARVNGYSGIIVANEREAELIARTN